MACRFQVGLGSEVRSAAAIGGVPAVVELDISRLTEGGNPAGGPQETMAHVETRIS